LDQLKAAENFRQAWGSPWNHYHHSTVSAKWVLRDAETKRGLRQFRQWGTNVVATRSGGICQTAIAEHHFDGSVGIVLCRGRAFAPSESAEPRVLATLDLEQAALNLLTLAQQAARHLQIAGDFEVRLSVEPAQSHFRHLAEDRPGKFRLFSEQDQVPPFQPVEGAIDLC
jgi:hypothetical protein